MSALEEKRESHLLKNNEEQKQRRKHMSNNHVQIVKDFFAAMGRGDKQGLLALSAEDIEWIIPGVNWPLAATYRGHAGLADLLQKVSDMVETSSPEPLEFVAQGDRVLVVGFARGRIIATNKTFEDDWVFAITVRNGKLTNIREYIDTQALARASEMSLGNEEISSENSMLPQRGKERISRSLSPFSRRKDTCATFLPAQCFAGRPLVTLLPPLLVHFLMSTVSYLASTSWRTSWLSSSQFGERIKVNWPWF
jgi:ketosteroid isomerase-like protein